MIVSKSLDGSQKHSQTFVQLVLKWVEAHPAVRAALNARPPLLAWNLGGAAAPAAAAAVVSAPPPPPPPPTNLLPEAVTLPPPVTSVLVAAPVPVAATVASRWSLSPVASAAALAVALVVAWVAARCGGDWLAVVHVATLALVVALHVRFSDRSAGAGDGGAEAAAREARRAMGAAAAVAWRLDTEQQRALARDAHGLLAALQGGGDGPAAPARRVHAKED